jgi:peptidyl-prolyl cis-trans isomerase A (cyclophilin A)
MKKILMIAFCMLFAAAVVHAEEANPKVLLETSLGNIVIELDAKKAPISTKNFLEYVDAGHYNGIIFHRVIKGFMIQGGGMTAGLQPKATRASIKNEADNGLKNVRGTIAMARTNVVDSATSQFFINTVDNANLDHKGPQSYGYAVFGKVVEGMDVVDKIESTPTGRMQGFQDVPLSTITIKNAKRL